jgi:hypothetical protein
MKKFIYGIVLALITCIGLHAGMPTMNQLKDENATLTFETRTGSFVIDCREGTVNLMAIPTTPIAGGQSIILRSLDLNNEAQQEAFCSLVRELRAGEASKLFASGPVQGDALTKSVELNKKLHLDTAQSGLPRFTVVVVDSDGNETLAGIARVGNAAKSVFAREDIKAALEEKNIAVAGGVAEPGVLLLPEYQRKGIAQTMSAFFFDVIASIYKGMNVPFGLPVDQNDEEPCTPWNWIHLTSSVANEGSSKALGKIPGAVKLGVFDREQTPKEYWLIPVPEVDLNVQKTETDGKVTYVVSKASDSD